MTTLQLVIRPLAHADIDDAYDWYELQHTGRGDLFADELRVKLQEIQAYPEHYGRIRRQIRAAPLPRSKFIVYYRIFPDSITVLAVQHASADPRKWQRRK